MPLSNLEARACGIPVVTTDYGSIKKYLDSDNGGIIYPEPNNLINSVSKFRNSSANNFFNTKSKVLNELFYKQITRAIEI